jgi:hypothetical protein
MNPIVRKVLLFILAVCLAALSGERPSALAAPRVVEFRVRTFLTTNGVKETASDSTVAGPPGTDLVLNVRTGPFRMTARLKTDLLGERTVRIKADVTTRRLAGASERGLPLYEEDSQSTIAEVAVDGSESLAIMPFGPNPDGDEIVFDVAPTLTDRSALSPSGKTIPLEIRLGMAGKGGWINVEARKVPHFFRVEAVLETEGRSVALGSARCSLGEAQVITLTAPGEPARPVAEIPFTVDPDSVGCAGEIGFTFDIHPPRTSDANPLARGWSGIAAEGSTTEYRLGDVGARLDGHPATLRLRIQTEEEVYR